MNKKLYSSKYVIYALVFFVFALLAQSILVWLFLPEKESFYKTEEISGVYGYGGGNSKSRTDTYIGKRAVFCSISYMGPEDSCFHSYLKGRTVKAKIARYKHLFGEGEVLVELEENGNAVIKLTPEQIVKIWTDDSISACLAYSIVLTVVFFAILIW